MYGHSEKMNLLITKVPSDEKCVRSPLVKNFADGDQQNALHPLIVISVLFSKKSQYLCNLDLV